MNTRQKLTLGIAAIFMVTLTIVGVTYAYFFTRVTTTNEKETNISASTAEISSIQYWEQTATTIELGPNALPGETATEKVFGAENPNAVNGSFRIALTTEDPAVPFIHSSDIEKDITKFEPSCYTTNAASAIGNDVAADSKCTAGKYYDNIVFDLYAADAQGNKTGNAIVSGVKVKVNAKVNGSGDAAEQFITDESDKPMVFTVDAKGAEATENPIKKFVLVVRYLNKTEAPANNQNLEFDADLTIRVTIK